MKASLLAFGCCLGATLANASPALAWGDEGHEIVALIAYSHLALATKTKVDQLLAADTDTLTASDFIARATWADAWKYSDNHGPRYQHTSKWHFVDLELSGVDLDKACNRPASKLPSGTAASDGPANSCALDKIDQFAVELANPATAQAEQILALKYIEHFIGDIHQPLHSADDDDSGGNCQHVNDATTGRSGLWHSWWDTDVVEAIADTAKNAAGAPLNPKDMKELGDYLNGQITDNEIADWQKGNATDWAMEAHAVASSTAYNKTLEAACLKGKPVGSVTLDAAYRAKAAKAASVQLQRGGIRLAFVLNQILK